MIQTLKEHLFRRKNIDSLEKKLELYQLHFFASSYHSWIVEDKNVKRAFNILFDALTEPVIDKLTTQNLICLKSHGILACTLSLPKNSNVLLIYPDLIKLLYSASPMNAIAILAHELGHIIHDHSHKNIGTIPAQLEADQVAFELGFGTELLFELKSFPSDEEYKLRIKHLERLAKDRTSFRTHN